MPQPEVLLDIKLWGNNLGIRLPVAVALAVRLHVNQRVRVAVEDGKIVITPVDVTVPSLEQRLAQFDPVKHGGESMAVDLVGAERW